MTVSLGHPPVQFPDLSVVSSGAHPPASTSSAHRGEGTRALRSADSAGTATVTLLSAHASEVSADTPFQVLSVRWQKGHCSQGARGPGAALHMPLAALGDGFVHVRSWPAVRTAGEMLPLAS